MTDDRTLTSVDRSMSNDYLVMAETRRKMQTLPGYESISILGMFGPAKTPEPIVRRLNQEIVRVLSPPMCKRNFSKRA